MSPRPKSDDPRTEQYRLRMTPEEMDKLNYCCEKLDKKKSEIIREGIDLMYELAKQTNK